MLTAHNFINSGLERREGYHYIQSAMIEDKMKNYFVYTHARATDGSIFYVGKGKDNRATTRKSRNPHWRNIVAKNGLIVVKHAEGLTQDEAFDLEVEMIAKFRAAGVALVNQTNGGEGKSGFTYTMSDDHKRAIGDAQRGVPKSPESVAKVAAALRGRKHTKEHKAKIGAASKGNQYRKGTKHSTETKAKIAAAGIGRKKSSEAIEKSAAAHRGVPKSPEHRAKISESLKGISPGPKSAETRAKMSNYSSNRSAEHRAALGAAFRGKPLSEDHRAKLSAAKKGRKAPHIAAYWARRRAEKQAAAACIQQ